MNQKQLAYFLTAYETGNIQAAADKLYISRQGVSRALRQLEDELAQPLFKRTVNGIAPTDFARSILPHVRQLLSEYDCIMGTQTLAAQRRSVVTVYALDHVAAWLGADFFLKFHEAHPRITPSFIESTDQEAADALAHGKGDFAITTPPFNLALFEARKLFDSPYCVRMKSDHPLAAKDVLTYTDLDGQTVAGKGRAYHCFREKIDHNVLACGLHLDILAETSDEAVLTELAASGKAIILEHAYTATLAMHPGTVLRPFSDGKETSSAEIYLLSRRNQILTQSSRLFQAFLLDYVTRKTETQR